MEERDNMVTRLDSQHTRHSQQQATGSHNKMRLMDSLLLHNILLLPMVNLPTHHSQ
jgi:hypothetical protein